MTYKQYMIWLLLAIGLCKVIIEYIQVPFSDPTLHFLMIINFCVMIIMYIYVTIIK